MLILDENINIIVSFQTGLHQIIFSLPVSLNPYAVITLLNTKSRNIGILNRYSCYLFQIKCSPLCHAAGTISKKNSICIQESTRTSTQEVRYYLQNRNNTAKESQFFFHKPQRQFLREKYFQCCLHSLALCLRLPQNLHILSCINRNFQINVLFLRTAISRYWVGA